jgi:hypothetical protein
VGGIWKGVADILGKLIYIPRWTSAHGVGQPKVEATVVGEAKLERGHEAGPRQGMGFYVKFRKKRVMGWVAEVLQRQGKLLKPIAVPEVVSLDCSQDGADGVRATGRELGAKLTCAPVAFRLRQRCQEENALRPRGPENRNQAQQGHR